MTKAKAKSARTRECFACGGVMRYETRDDSIEYRGQIRTIATAAWWCSSCAEAVLDGEALAGREAAFVELRAHVDNVLSPSEVLQIRKRLGISQRRAGEVLGGGPRAFQKYEKGTTAVSVPMSNLLRLLAKDPMRLKELEEAKASFGRGLSRSRQSEAKKTCLRERARVR